MQPRASRSRPGGWKIGGAICLALALAGCAASTGEAVTLDGRMDGAYVGTRTLDPICGTETDPIRFDVAGSTISVHARHNHVTLQGTVTADGQIALTDFAGDRHINGAISNGRLTATELTSGNGNKRHQKLALDELTPVPCLWHFSATRQAEATDRPGVR